MDRITAPFDEERQKTIEIIFEVERFPAQHFAIWARAGPIARLLDGQARCPGAFSNCCKIVSVRDPADNSRLLNGGETRRPPFPAGSRTCLLRIGRDDLQIAARPQGQKRIACAPSGRNAARNGMHTAALLEPRNSMGEVAYAEQYVVKIGRHG